LLQEHFAITTTIESAPTPSRRLSPKKKINGLFFILFSVTYFILYLSYSTVPEAILSDCIYHYGIAYPSKTMIDWISPSEHVVVAGNSLISATVNLRVIRGCDGSGVIFLLVAAIIAMRTTLRRTLLGIVGVVALVYVLNQLRIVALYFILSRWPSWFTPVHVYFIPTLMILVGTIYFAAWAAHPQYEVRHSPSR
jgi:exosortase family protein XrtM